MKSAAEVAEAAASSVCGIRILLDCLVSFHLLTKAQQRYRLAPISARYLRKSSPDYMGHVWDNEQSLAEAGYEGFETADIGSHSPLLVARKRSIS